MKVQVIKDIDGNELYSDEASSKRALVETLIKEGKSLAGADLSNQKLTHLDFSGADFRNANLSGSDMRGSVAEKADFTGADLRGIKAAGFKSTRSDFSGVNLSRLITERRNRRASLEGAILSYSVFNGANLNNADFSDADMASASFVGAKMKGARFRDASLNNVDWTGATVINCDLREANMLPTHKIADKHLPDRTRNTIVSGNRMDGAKIGPGNTPFMIDRFTSRTIKATAAAAATTGVLYLGNALNLDNNIDALKTLVGSGVGVVATIAAANFLREKAEDFLKDNVLSYFAKSQVAVRYAITKLCQRGKALSELAVAFATNREARRILKHINKNADGTVLHTLGSMLTGKMSVIVCDRKKLSDAMVALSAFREKRMQGEGDLVLMRLGKGDPEIPTAIVLDDTGKAAAIWNTGEDKTAGVVWSEDGVVEDAVGDRRFASRWMDREGVMEAFQRAVQFDTGTEDLVYDPATHGIRQGRDGSIVVVKTSNGRIDNKNGPAVLSPEGTRMWFKNAKRYTQDGKIFEENEEEPGGFGIPGMR